VSYLKSDEISILREFINEALVESKPFDTDLVDDASFKKQSAFVPDDIKKQIKAWAIEMGLTKKKRKR
jgi:hypothetical protein